MNRNASRQYNDNNMAHGNSDECDSSQCCCQLIETLQMKSKGDLTLGGYLQSLKAPGRTELAARAQNKDQNRSSTSVAAVNEYDYGRESEAIVKFLQRRDNGRRMLSDLLRSNDSAAGKLDVEITASKPDGVSKIRLTGKHVTVEISVRKPAETTPTAAAETPRRPPSSYACTGNRAMSRRDRADESTGPRRRDDDWAAAGSTPSVGTNRGDVSNTCCETPRKPSSRSSRARAPVTPSRGRAAENVPQALASSSYYETPKRSREARPRRDFDGQLAELWDEFVRHGQPGAERCNHGMRRSDKRGAFTPSGSVLDVIRMCEREWSTATPAVAKKCSCNCH